jgi:hypothetical protein
MPFLHNHTSEDLVAWDLGRVVLAGGSIEITDAEAELFEEHPHLDVQRAPAPGRTKTSKPEEPTEQPANPANDNKESD